MFKELKVVYKVKPPIYTYPPLIHGCEEDMRNAFRISERLLMITTDIVFSAEAVQSKLATFVIDKQQVLPMAESTTDV